ADSLISDADHVLGIAQPLLSGGADLPGVTAAISQAEPLLEKLNGAGLPGLFGEAIAAIGPASKLLGPALAGIPAGPIGIIGGLVMGGLDMLKDQQKFEAWKSALLAKPFDRSLLPPVVDGNLAQLVLQLSPMMGQRLAGAAPDLATNLLRSALEMQANGDPKSTADVAAELWASEDMADLRGRFASTAELARALEEYRGSSIFLQASKSLAGKINIPPLTPGAKETSVELPTLMRSALQLRTDPRAASALDQLAYIVQGLGALHLGPEKLMALVQSGLQLGAKLAGDHQSEEPRQ
ncbi:MAG: hypothetical protein JO227_21930, partial [Acetobacteraceae bacterium]|nr:hypothetical protein [Acetobacteraceae bacterium]